MSTVAQLIDRTYREILHPSDDQPLQTTLNATVTNVQTSWVYVDTILSADEEELIAPGVVLECEQEQVVVLTSDLATNTVTVRRGANGTTAAAHNAGAVITVAPVFPRKVIFDAIADNVAALYPTLYRVATVAVTVGANYTEVPAVTSTAVGLRYLSGGKYYEADVTLLTNFTPSSTTKAVLVDGARTGASGYFTYRGAFTRPTTEADDLQTACGVDLSWERIVMYGAAVQALAARDLDAVNQEYVTEAVRAEGFPPGTSGRLRDSLLRMQEYWLDKARRGLLATNAEVVSYQPVV